MNQHFQNGRLKALAEIEAKLEAKYNQEVKGSEHFTNSNRHAAPPQRSSRVRLGFGNTEHEHRREQQALENAVKAGRIQNRTTLPSGGQSVARASDGLFIPTPADIRAAMNRNRDARAELHRVTIENQAAAKRRLGLGNSKSALIERLANLLEGDE